MNTKKTVLITILIWLANPVASHLVCKIEVETNDQLEKECEVKNR